MTNNSVNAVISKNNMDLKNDLDLKNDFDNFDLKNDLDLKNDFDLNLKNNDLEIIEWKDTVPFMIPFNTAQVIKVYDGDTITIASKLPFNNSLIYRFAVRLNGIDCPEIKGHTEDEKEMAQLAKNELSKIILHKIIRLENISTEKYGRILADIYLDDLHLNDYMLKQRLAIPYFGNKKTSPKSWRHYYLTGEL
jgi:micrococcal nuclease